MKQIVKSLPLRGRDLTIYVLSLPKLLHSKMDIKINTDYLITIIKTTYITKKTFDTQSYTQEEDPQTK